VEFSSLYDFLTHKTKLIGVFSPFYEKELVTVNNAFKWSEKKVESIVSLSKTILVGLGVRIDHFGIYRQGCGARAQAILGGWSRSWSQKFLDGSRAGA